MQATRRSTCPAACALDIAGDRWTLLIVRDLLRGRDTYGKLAASDEGIPTNILADRLEMPRPRLLAELERLVALGYVAEAGKAASRGGRRSTLVELSPELRFAAVDLGASSIDVEVVNGRLEPVAAYAEAADIRSGPKAILQRFGIGMNQGGQLVNAPLHLSATQACKGRFGFFGHQWSDRRFDYIFSGIPDFLAQATESANGTNHRGETISACPAG